MPQQLGADTNADSLDEFEAAFAQAGRARPERTPQSSGAVEIPEDEAGEPEDRGATAGADSASPADSDRGATTTEQSSHGATEKPGAPDGESIDAIKQRLAEALHRERSTAGRIASADRRVNELTREVAQLREQLSASKQAPRAAEAGADADDVLDGTPELKDAVQRRISQATSELESKLNAALQRLESLGQRTDSLAGAVQPVVERSNMAAIEAVWSGLDAAFGQAWRQDIRTTDFKLWLAEQSEAIQNLFEDSVSIKDTSAVLSMFYASRRRGGQQGGASNSASTTQRGQTAARTPNTAASSDRLRNAAGIAPRTSQPTRTDPNDFDSAFAEAAAALQKQGQSR